MAAILASLTFTGCTKAVNVPVDQVDSAAQVHGISHRITMIDGARYAVDRFSTTDSTVTIIKLNQADTRYKRVKLPIVLEKDDITSLERFELDHGKSFLLVAPIGLFVMLVVGLAIDPPTLN